MRLKFIRTGQTVAEIGEGPADQALDVHVEPDEDCEKADFSVCCTLDQVPERFRDTNILGECSKCGVAISFRPHLPKKPKKICMECMLKMAKEEAERQDSQ